jgi:shikimate kinase
VCSSDLIFRKAEAETLTYFLDDANAFSDGGAEEKLVILAAGGGIIDNEDALTLLKKYGTALIVYLEVLTETAWERIRAAAEKSGELPPFLNTNNPKETHRALHQRRAAAYKKLADITIYAEKKSPKDIAGKIYALIRKA